MKLIISQAVYFSDCPKFPFRWTKELIDPVVYPHKGDRIGDSIWKDPYEYEVIDVVIDYAASEYSVTVADYSDDEGKLVVIDASRKNDFANMAKGHGWKASW